MAFADNLSRLPETAHLLGVELTAPDGTRESIGNVPGSQGSVRVYAYLAGKYGAIDVQAAADGVEIYAEHGEDARLHPGKHPNIDRLLRIMQDGRAWQARPIPQQ